MLPSTNNGSCLGWREIVKVIHYSARWWSSSNMREMWNESEVFRQSSGRRGKDDEDGLMWAAIERLPTHDRLKRGMLKQVTGSGRLVCEV